MGPTNDLDRRGERRTTTGWPAPRRRVSYTLLTGPWPVRAAPPLHEGVGLDKMSEKIILSLYFYSASHTVSPAATYASSRPYSTPDLLKTLHGHCTSVLPPASMEG